MQNYYLGLDLGTSSVGWAVSDEFYNLLRAKGKDLWGVRLFDDAKTALERRTFRSQRRRVERARWRLSLLRELFKDELNRVDDKFLQRLDDSKFLSEDKSEIQPNTLFNDKKLKDKDYHKEFPSIYHLRNALVCGDEKFDIRLVFLALSHIVKKRGHFLFEGEIASNLNYDELISDFKIALEDSFKIELDFGQNFKDIILDKTFSKKEKKEKIKESFTLSFNESDENLDLNRVKISLIDLLLGFSTNLKPLLPESDSKEIKISLSSSDYEEKLANLPDELASLVEYAKRVYDYFLLSNIMEDSTNISASKIEICKKHQGDLKKLKDYAKEESIQLYNKIFRKILPNNYVAYSKHYKGKDKSKLKGCSKEAFYDFLKKELQLSKATDENNPKSFFQKEVENGTFLPRLVDNNSVIPHQLHLYELEKILENQAKFYPFLKEIRDKIVAIFKFRIPFYVGPLNDFHKDSGGNAWIEKKKDERILPWSFDEVVDLEASAKNFIEKMTNSCSYLKDEKTLPKHSLLYVKFSVLNLINNIKINSDSINVEMKQKLYNELLLKQKKVKKSSIKNFLIKQGIMSKDDEIIGIDDELTSNLAVWIDFAKFPDLTYRQKEQIIEQISLFGYDKTMLKKQIRKITSSLDENELEQLCKLNYSGFGRLSKKFLTEIKHGDKSIIEMLWESNENLMELLSDKYSFSKQIDLHNKSFENDEKISYEMLDNLYVSPSVKRSIWQTLKIVKELKSVLKSEPKKIFIEMARGEEEKRRTKPRKATMEELYKNIKESEILSFISNFNELNEKLKKERNLNSKKLYLYYLQFGRDIYTGEPIPSEALFDNNIYDIDHIIPRSVKNDDSFDNLVLTNRTTNAKKTDIFPLPKEIQGKMRSFWTILKDKKLMSERKFANLTRSEPLSDEEKAGFIARQLVETRQSTKELARILKNLFKDSQIVYVKSRIVSEFRQKFDLIKVRELNDLHHAKDAYLNIAIGNACDVKFTQNPLNFIKNKHKKGEEYTLKIERMLEKDIVRNRNFGWDSKQSREIVKKTMSKNSPLVTYMTYEEKGQLFDLQPVKAAKDLIPLKKDSRLQDTEKYGGYSGKRMAYFFLVEYDDKKKKKRKIESVHNYLAKEIENGKLSLKEYCRDVLELENPKILIPKILKNSTLIYNGFVIRITGNNKKQLLGNNNTQLILDKKQEILLKAILKVPTVDLSFYSFNGVSFEEGDLDEFYEIFISKHKNSVFLNRPAGQIKTLEENREKFKTLNTEDKMKVLKEILNLFTTNAVNSNLTLLGAGASNGGIKIAKNINPKNSYILVQTSVTGLFSTKTDLNAL